LVLVLLVVRCRISSLEFLMFGSGTSGDGC
jgi:hypothetical protein